MLGLSPALATAQVRIFLYAKDVDMRKSFDSLYGIVQTEFKKDVRLGDLFLFLNRRLDRIKLIYWDRDGLAIWMKRLEQGTFQRPLIKQDCNQIEIDATELALLLSGIDLETAKRRKRYSIDRETRVLIKESCVV
jgi:transposase